MKIPILERENRKCEYEYFSTEQHQAVVDAYLFKGMSFRKIEEKFWGWTAIIFAVGA